jgi:hypothetical protein
MALTLLTEDGGRLLRQNTSSKQRKTLATKIGKILEQDTKMLSKEMQEVLMDDLVTAFLNRLDILKRANNIERKNGLTVRCSDETLEMMHGQSLQA